MALDASPSHSIFRKVAGPKFYLRLSTIALGGTALGFVGSMLTSATSWESLLNEFCAPGTWRRGLVILATLTIVLLVFAFRRAATQVVLNDDRLLLKSMPGVRAVCWAEVSSVALTRGSGGQVESILLCYGEANRLRLRGYDNMEAMAEAMRLRMPGQHIVEA